MLMKLLPVSEVVDDHVPALSAPQFHVHRKTDQRWHRIARFFLACLDAARQRRHLLALDKRILKDVGISRIDALREADRSFWDLPEHLKPRR